MVYLNFEDITQIKQNTLCELNLFFLNKNITLLFVLSCHFNFYKQK